LFSDERHIIVFTIIIVKNPSKCSWFIKSDVLFLFKKKYNRLQSLVELIKNQFH